VKSVRKGKMKKIIVLLAVLGVFIRTTEGTTIRLQYEDLLDSSSAVIHGGGYKRANLDIGICKLSDEGGNYYYGFCTDLPQALPNWPSPYKETELLGGPSTVKAFAEIITESKVGYIADLFSKYYNPSWIDSSSDNDDDDEEVAAFVLALWEIIYEDVPDSPVFYDVNLLGTKRPLGFSGAVSVPVSELANQWLHSLCSSSSSIVDFEAQFNVFSSPKYQDVITVPEPATVLILGLGSLVFFIKR